MTRVTMDITMSLDGYTAGPRFSVTEPLGIGGQPLHAWLTGGGSVKPVEADRQAAQAMFTNTGAFIMGRNTFDVGEPHWGEDGAFGTPCFVVTHRKREMHVRGKTTFTFVTEGLTSALEQAKAASGKKNVCIMGGGNVASQYLAAGVVDELRLHIAPVLLFSGERLLVENSSSLFRVGNQSGVVTPLATHLRLITSERKPD